MPGFFICPQSGIDIAAKSFETSLPMKRILKIHPLQFIFLLMLAVLISCEKQDDLAPQPVPEVRSFYISFKQDTVPVTLSVVSARKEMIGSLLTTAVDGKLPDSITNKTSLIIRVTGDSARTYNNTEILASYTDSIGNTYSNTVSDTMNVVKITRLEKKKDGILEGIFTIRVSNFTKTKTIILHNGKFSAVIAE